jgi:hypothetical protein
VAGGDPGDDMGSRPYVDAAAAMAVYLTTISYHCVDSDLQRILDASVNPFHDEFAATSASRESLTATMSEVLVAVSVHTEYAETAAA